MANFVSYSAIGFAFFSCSLSFHRTCYFSNWAFERPHGYDFSPKNFKVQLCSQIIFAFAQFDDELQIIQTNHNDVKFYHMLRTIIDEDNPKADFLLAIGGANFHSKNFGIMARNVTLRKLFVSNLLTYVRKYNFDGIDIDWEFPNGTQNFTNLLEDLREAVNNEKSYDLVTNKPKKKLIISAAVTPSPYFVKYDTFQASPPEMSAYEIARLFELLDHINLMTYDLNREDFISHHSRIKSAENETIITKELAINGLLNEWLKHGNSSKIHLGLAFYGRTHLIKYSNKHQLDDGILKELSNGIYGRNLTTPKQKGDAGMITNEQGILAYYEICKLFNTKVTSSLKISQPIYYDNLQVPYITVAKLNENNDLDLQWIGYDDPTSIEFKIKYARSRNLGGVMIWSIDLDDFKGNLCGKTYPLSRVVYEVATGKNSSEFLSDMPTPSRASRSKSLQNLVGFITIIWLYYIFI